MQPGNLYKTKYLYYAAIYAAKPEFVLSSRGKHVPADTHREYPTMDGYVLLATREPGPKQQADIDNMSPSTVVTSILYKDTVYWLWYWEQFESEVFCL